MGRHTQETKDEKRGDESVGKEAGGKTGAVRVCVCQGGGRGGGWRDQAGVKRVKVKIEEEEWDEDGEGQAGQRCNSDLQKH